MRGKFYIEMIKLWDWFYYWDGSNIWFGVYINYFI